MTEPQPDPELRGSLAIVASIVYGLFLVAALLWLYLRDRGRLLAEQAVGAHGPFVSLALGVAVGLAVSGVVALLVRYHPSFRELEVTLREAIGPLSEAEIVLIAMTSAIGEELFFRCALQDVVGLWFAALIFGLLHARPGLWLMGLFAWVLGVCFGLMVDRQWGLLSVTVAHALINFISLRRIALR